MPATWKGEPSDCSEQLTYHAGQPSNCDLQANGNAPDRQENTMSSVGKNSGFVSRAPPAVNSSCNNWHVHSCVEQHPLSLQPARQKSTPLHLTPPPPPPPAISQHNILCKVSLVHECRKGDSRRFGPLVQRALVGGPTKSCEGLQCLEPDCQVNLSHFEDLLQEIDNTLRSLPATGQVTPHPSFMHSLTRSFLHSFNQSFIHSFMHSFVHYLSSPKVRGTYSSE